MRALARFASDRAVLGRALAGGILLRRHWLSLLAFALVGYFSYHLVDGNRGLLAWQQYGQELETTRAELARLRTERAALERRIERLRHDSLDPDLLDEEARRTLSLVDPMDVIVLLEPESPVR